jgi:hypothetical protein
MSSRSGVRRSGCLGRLPKNNVADPGCLYRIPDPDFYPFRIPDLGSRIQKQQQKRGVRKIFLCLFVGTNITKLKIILFEMLKKTIWASFQRVIELFTQKFVTNL